jgi:DNA invertase Pin-like site-specific DNA recombinase
MNENKNCRTYVRVSTDEQVKDGVSIEQQQKDIERYCEYNQFTIVKTYLDEGYSGTDMERPQFNLLLFEAQAKELIIVYDLSRFSRKTWHAIKTAEDLSIRDIYLVSLKDRIDLSTAMGKCMFSMTCVFFALERDKISERTSAALQHLSKEGKLRSKAPFGWRYIGWDKDLEPVPEQQAVAKRIIEMHKEGISLSGMCTKLNKEGLNSCLTLNKETDKIQVFYPQTVKRILIQEGIINDDKAKIKPMEQRIVSHHKDDKDKVKAVNKRIANQKESNSQLTTSTTSTNM